VFKWQHKYQNQNPNPNLNHNIHKVSTKKREDDPEVTIVMRSGVVMGEDQPNDIKPNETWVCKATKQPTTFNP